MKKIRLTQGRVALVDDADYEFLSKYRWRLSPGGYAVRSIIDHNKERVIRMHRVIMQPAPHEIIDHINGDKLDNRRANLRATSHGTNNQNVLSVKSETGFKGVSKRGEMYLAIIEHGKKKTHLGTYDTPLEAAAAYDREAVKLYGKNAATNHKILKAMIKKLLSFK